jgi:Kef-type K+ transport system membrane component KefB
MTRTTVGRLSLTGAAAADVLAWVLLALVVVLVRSGSDWVRFSRMLIGVALVAALTFLVLRPLAAQLLSRYASDGRPAGTVLAALLVGTFGCAYATSEFGVHAVFGAFLFGACLPRDDRLLQVLIERIEYVAVLVLMPVFFALAGLNTTPAAFVGTGLGALLLILAAAIGGKILGGSLGARLGGQRWRAALAIGSLMSARGLMELVVMKVGLDAGVIGREIFTMLLVMAILTTMMTGPLLSLFAGRQAAEVLGRSSA